MTPAIRKPTEAALGKGESALQMDCRPDTVKALRMFLDTITALQSANDYGRNALEVLDQKSAGFCWSAWRPELESMVEFDSK